MASHVDLESASLVVALVTAWKGADELARLTEVCPVVREKRAEGDEGLFAA